MERRRKRRREIIENAEGCDYIFSQGVLATTLDLAINLQHMNRNVVLKVCSSLTIVHLCLYETISFLSRRVLKDVFHLERWFVQR